MNDPLTILDQIARSDSIDEIDTILAAAAEAAGYYRHLDVPWDYWHYGRHAELADSLGLQVLGCLFRAAWQIELSRSQPGSLPAAERNAIRDAFAKVLLRCTR